MHARPRHCSVVLVCAVGALLGNAARADDLRPSWECLPQDTVAIVRLPNPSAFLETLRTRTKFGAVVLGADRAQKAWDLAVRAWAEGDDEADDAEGLEERLAKYGLGRPDLEAAFAGDMGLGFVLRSFDEDQAQLMMVLAWLEPGTEAAERMVAAFHRLLDEQADDEFPPQRVELELAGHPVTWVARPVLRAELGDIDLDGVDLAEMRRVLAERAKQAPKVVVGRQHVFLARVGGRLLVGQSQVLPRGGIGLEAGGPGAAVGVQVEDAAGATDAELDVASGTDEAREIFERYLAAHTADGAAELADVVNAAGVRAALPAGSPLVDVIVDPRPFLNRAKATDEAAAARMAAAGLADLGPAALRIAFDEGVLRQGIFMTLPAPRAGLFRILDQDCDVAEVPSFVTSEAIDFTQISLDLAAAYRTIKEFAIAEQGEQAANLFATVEAQSQAVLGTDLEAMLANLGSRHCVITYPSQVAAAVEEARRKRVAGGGPAPSGGRVALAWKLDEEAPVIALLPKLAALAQAQVVEEQGFQGVRLPGGAAAVFVGQGHLVVGIGGDALEKTLAGIRNPPAGAASLRESDVPRKGAELVDFGRCRMFAVGDATRTGGMFGELRELALAMVPDDVEEGSRELLAKVQALLPTAEEMQGMFGVGATALEMNDAGVALRSAWEMPAP